MVTIKNKLQIFANKVLLHVIKYIGIYSIIVTMIVMFIVIRKMPEDISSTEIRVYIWLFLLASFIMGFASLRLYNAIVVNSRFISKLRDSLGALSKKLVDVDRTMKTSQTKMGQIANSLGELKNKNNVTRPTTNTTNSK